MLTWLNIPLMGGSFALEKYDTLFDIAQRKGAGLLCAGDSIC